MGLCGLWQEMACKIVIFKMSPWPSWLACRMKMAYMCCHNGKNKTPVFVVEWPLSDTYVKSAADVLPVLHHNSKRAILNSDHGVMV